MERSGFHWKEIEEDDIKRSRWVIPMDDENMVRQATRAWVELGIRLVVPNNRECQLGLAVQLYGRDHSPYSAFRRAATREESLKSGLQIWDLSSAIQSTLSRSIRMQPRVDTPGDRRTILDARKLQYTYARSHSLINMRNFSQPKQCK